MGSGDDDSFAASIAPPAHWSLVDCIALISEAQKPTGSTQGHALAGTSPLQAARVADCPRRLDLCRRAILERDFDALAGIVELDSDMMHKVMMTSSPPLHYSVPASDAVVSAVHQWRRDGLNVCATLDAGPNVHAICVESHGEEVANRLRQVEGVKNVLVAGVGGPAGIIPENHHR
jgi:diphosphomevalonate decarboxylase